MEKEIEQSRIDDALLLKELNYSQTATETSNENYQLAGENADLQRQKFEQGLVSLDTYLDSFDDYLKAEVSWLNYLLESYNHYSKILSRNY